MKIGNKTIPLYFNMECLKFNPFIFLKEYYSHKLFWIIMPILFILMKAFGGGLEFAGMEKNWFTLFLRAKTDFDIYAEELFANFWFLFSDNPNKISLWFVIPIGWFFISFLTYLKLMSIGYILFKIYFVFFVDIETFQNYDKLLKVVINNSKKDNTNMDEIVEIVESNQRALSIMKRC